MEQSDNTIDDLFRVLDENASRSLECRVRHNELIKLLNSRKK